MDVNIPLLAFLYSRDALTRDEKQVIMVSYACYSTLSILYREIYNNFSLQFYTLLLTLPLCHCPVR